MNSANNFHEVSYELHEKHHEITGELSALQQSWFTEDTVDYWRHERFYKTIVPLLKHNTNAKWITIGDGRFGLDSIKLKKIEPALDILPTDISPSSLEYAKQHGMITKYARVNAEAIDFPDNSFDFAFCKEAYHHFPRPFLALYEMLRVAKQAVIFIEPNEHYFKPLAGKWLKFLKNSIKKMIGKTVYHTDHWHYETVGNYIYSMSKREIEKVALGLNYPAIAYQYLNDYYEEGVEFGKKENNSKIFRRIKNKIKMNNIKCKLGLNVYSNIVVVIFKKMPDKILTEELRSSGFTVSELPQNPYV